MGSTHTAKVSILGLEYTLKGDAAPDRITELAQYVDGKMQQAKAKSGQPYDLGKVAILTSLNIAFELFKCRADAEEGMSDVRRQAAELADRLELCLVEDEDAAAE